MSTGDNNKQHLLSKAAERLKWTNVCRAPATPPDAKSDLLGKTLMLGKIEGRRRRGPQRMIWHHRHNGHEFEQTLGYSDREAWSATVHEVAKSETQLSN